jgi:hypothetical protein
MKFIALSAIATLLTMTNTFETDLNEQADIAKIRI